MARFVFELASVLAQRAREERTRQQDVAALETQRLAIEERAAQINRRIGAGRDELRTALVGAGGAGVGGGAGPVAMHAVRLAAHSSLHGVLLLQRAAIELAGVHQKLRGARGRLLAATTARKAVEALKDRRFVAWRAQEKSREERAADDLMVMRAALGAEAL